MEQRVRTAGALVWVRGAFVFMMGPTERDDRLGVVRLGGHREPGESIQECAIREAAEEASLAIRLVAPPATYFAGPLVPPPPQLPPAVAWEGEMPPLLVTPRSDGNLSAIFLAVSDDIPIPAAEARALLLPDREWLSLICARRYQLREYLAAGGRAVLPGAIPEHLPLEPSFQVRLLERILVVHPELTL